MEPLYLPWMSTLSVIITSWFAFSLTAFLYSLHTAEYEKPGQQLG
ncbi:MAG: hypothetical protein ACK2UR_11165 [Candidatus Promineifilaceae bacterium]|jgi:hypothetical protein